MRYIKTLWFSAVLALPALAAAETMDSFEYWDTNGDGDLTCAETLGRTAGLRLPAYRDNTNDTAKIYEWLTRIRGDSDNDGIECADEANSDGYVPMTPMDHCGKPPGRRGPTITSVSPNLVTPGESLMIVGQNLRADNQPTTVEVDCFPTSFTFDQSGGINVTAVPDPVGDVEGARLTRHVIVDVGGNRSEAASFKQLTWRVIREARVAFSLLIYLAIVSVVAFKHNAAVFMSAANGWSLSKTQMALWTFVFGLSYITLATARAEFLDISQGMLWLMGISSATAVGAKVSAANRSAEAGAAGKQLTASGFLTENKRLSLHRCQIAIWTAVLVCIYVWMFVTTMRLPDIPDNLLVLMGISGGTYLGFHRS